MEMNHVWLLSKFSKQERSACVRGSVDWESNMESPSEDIGKLNVMAIESGCTVGEVTFEDDQWITMKFVFEDEGNWEKFCKSFDAKMNEEK